MPIPGGVADVIVSLPDAKAELNLTSSASDAELQDFIDRASAMLLNHPDFRVADAVGLTTYTEWHDGIATAYRTLTPHVSYYASDDPTPLLMAHYPAASVTSVTEYMGGTATALAYEPTDGGAFTSSGWRYRDDTGSSGLMVRTADGFPIAWRGRVKVVYTAGSPSVPADIRGAALVLIAHLWESQRGPGVALPPGTDVVESSGTFGQPYGPSYALPDRVREMLAAYQSGPRVA